MKSKNWIIAALWFGGMANYFDRTVISFAGPTIMRSLSIDARGFGVILSSFAVGYVLAQIPSGLVSDRWGAKPIIVIAPLFWALFTGVTGLVATVGAFALMRALLGASEAAALGAAAKVQGDNFTPKQRSLAQGIALTAIAIAPAIAGPALGFLFGHLSWKTTFLILAVPAILASAFSQLAIPSGGGQRGHAPATLAASNPGSAAGFRAILKRPSFWTVTATWFMFNIAYWGFQGWMPSYLALTRHIDIHKLGMLGSIPYWFGAAGLISIGWLGSAPLYRFRPQILAVTYLLAAASLFLAYNAVGLGMSLTGLSAAAFFLFGGIGTFQALVLDLAPAATRATYWAAVSTFGQLAGIVAPGVIGYLVSTTGAFAGGFGVMESALCGAAIIVLALRRWDGPGLAATEVGTMAIQRASL